jgi:voltage-gated potassium channel
MPDTQTRLSNSELEAEQRLTTAEQLARRLDTPMGALGLVFLFVVLGQTLTADPGLSTGLAILGWALWAVFVAELGLRAYVAHDQRRFWRRNWWQLAFLVIPFLRALRAVRALRGIGRLGGVLSSAVRGSRSAGRLLTGRLGWLAVVTGVVVLASSQALYLLGVFESYGAALHRTALATVTGQPFGVDSGVANTVEVMLAVYSVVVFATVAGALGAYFLQRPDREVQGGAEPSPS